MNLECGRGSGGKSQGELVVSDQRKMRVAGNFQLRDDDRVGAGVDKRNGIVCGVPDANGAEVNGSRRSAEASLRGGCAAASGDLGAAAREHIAKRDEREEAEGASEQEPRVVGNRLIRRVAQAEPGALELVTSAMKSIRHRLPQQYLRFRAPGPHSSHRGGRWPI